MISMDDRMCEAFVPICHMFPLGDFRLHLQVSDDSQNHMFNATSRRPRWKVDDLQGNGLIDISPSEGTLQTIGCVISL
jgi:hypothetical protein